MATRRSGNVADGETEAKEELRKTGGSGEGLELGAKGGDLDGLIEEGGLDPMGTGQQKDAGKGHSGPKPVDRGVVGGMEEGEDRRLVGELAIPRPNAAAHVEGADDSLFQRSHEPGDRKAISGSAWMHPGGQFPSPTRVVPQDRVAFGDEGGSAGALGLEREDGEAGPFLASGAGERRQDRVGDRRRFKAPSPGAACLEVVIEIGVDGRGLRRRRETDDSKEIGVRRIREEG